MKKLCMITIGLCALGLIAPGNVSAAKADGKKAQVFAKYDTNKNGVLDPDEKKAIQDDYAKNPNGELKAFDKNGDGKLSDEELAGIKPGSGKAKDGSAKGKKKDTSATKATENTTAKPEGTADKTVAPK